MDLNNQNISIFACQFAAFVEKAKVQIKFPCNYFLQWKASNGKIVVSSKNRYQANKSQIVFNESLSINVNMLYDKVNKKYLKKQSLLMINLISKSRPDQIKLVGRVAIDLAEVLNSQSFNELSTAQLEYCSVDAALNFKIQSISVKQSAMHVSQLDRSSFSEYMSFQNNLKPHQQFIQRNDGSSTQRDFDEVGSARGSDRGEIKSLGKDRNKLSSPYINRLIFNQGSRPISRNGSTLSHEQNKSNRSSRILSDLQEGKKMLSPKKGERNLLDQQNNFSFNKNAEQELKTNILTNSFAEDQSEKIDKKRQLIRSEVKRELKIQFSSLINKQQQQCQELKYPEKKQQQLLLSQKLSGSKTKENSPLLKLNQIPSITMQPTNKPIKQIENIAFRQEIILQKQQVTTTTNQSEQQSLLQSHFPSTIINYQRETFPSTHLQNNVIFPFNRQNHSKRFTAQIQSQRQSNSKRLNAELQRSRSESKRIIGLTQALTQLQAKYTQLTLQTEELRNVWKKEKQQLFDTITKQQTKINMKQKQLRQQQNIVNNLEKRNNELSQSNNQYQTRIEQIQVRNSQLQTRNSQLQKIHNQKLKEFIMLKNDYQTVNNDNIKIKNQNAKMSQENKTIKQQLKKIQTQLKLLNSQSQVDKDQLCKNYNKQRTVYQQQLAAYEQQLRVQKQKVVDLRQMNQQSVKQLSILNEQLDEVKCQNELIKTQVKFVQQENKNYIQQINSLNHQIQSLQELLQNKQKQIDEKSQNQHTNKYQQRQSIEQKEKILCFQDKGQLAQRLREKCEQIQKVRRQCADQIIRIRQISHNQICQLSQTNQSLVQKNQQLQNTLLTLNDQLTHYQQQIIHNKQQFSYHKQQLSNLQQQLVLKQEEITSIKQKNNQVAQSQSQRLNQHQQLLLQLNSQKEFTENNLILLKQQIQQLQQIISQRNNELQQSHQQNDNIKHQLQILKAQSIIYDSKLQSLHQQFQTQLQTNKITYNKKIYSFEIKLQQQTQKYKLSLKQQSIKQQQLHQLNQVLKQALQEWQNKCTQSTISSSKTVAALNDLVKEKESTMYQMENIMRMLQKDKQAIQEQMAQKEQQFNATLQLLNQKHNKLKDNVEMQQSQLINLYEVVKKQRTSLRQQIEQKKVQITQINDNSQKLAIRMSQLTKQNEELIGSLQKMNDEMNKLKREDRKQVQLLKSMHNQQTDEYEERIRQLEHCISVKDNQSIEKQLVILQLQKVTDELKQQLQCKYQQVQTQQKEIQSKYYHLQSFNKQLQSMKQQLQQIKQEVETKNLQLGSKHNQITKYIQSQQQLLAQIQSQQQQNIKLTQTLQQSKSAFQQQLIKHSQLQHTLLQSQQQMNSKILSLSTQNSQLQTQLTQMSHLIKQKQHAIKALQEQFILNKQTLSIFYQRQISTLKQQNISAQQRLTAKITQLQELIVLQDQQISLKNTQNQSISYQKIRIENQLNQLKNDKQTIALINFKEHSDKLKSTINHLNQEIIILKNQLKQIPLLQRALKIKTIEINSLKFKSNSNNTSSINPNSHFQDIIKLKDEEIQFFRQQSQRMKELQLQLYQVETLNEGLYQDIEQYEEEKFSLESGMNENRIKIRELQKEVSLLSNSKAQLKESNHQLSDKIKYYENLILDYKGHELSSTKSQSQKINSSNASSVKLMQNSCEVETQNSRLLEIQTFVKKIGILEGQLEKLRERQQKLTAKNEQNQIKLKEYEDKHIEYEKKLSLKQSQLIKINKQKSSIVTVSKTVIQYRNPQRIVGSLKELQNLLKKRSHFHSLQTSLIKLYNSNQEQKLQNQHADLENNTQKHQKCGVHANLTNTINELSSEFQSLKARIMKLEGKNYQQKAKIISLLKPIENGIKSALNYSQSS